MTQYNLTDKLYYNWVLSAEEQKILNNNRLLNVSLAFIGPDLTDQNVEYFLTYPPIFDIMDI